MAQPKKISQLTPKTLALTDVFVSANPSTGLAGKATLSQLKTLILGGTQVGFSIADTYADIAELLTEQVDQVTGRWYMVVDASADTSVTSGWAIYQYLGTTDGDIDDYLKIAEEESLDINLSGYVQAGAITTSGLTMSTAKLLGRTTASTGAVEEITVGNGLTLSSGVLASSGLGGSVGSTDNAVLRADVGSGVVQGSAVTINDSGDVVIGTTSIAGGRTLSVASSDTNARLILRGQGQGVTSFQRADDSDTYIAADSMIGIIELVKTAVSAKTMFFRGAAGISGSTAGGDAVLVAGRGYVSGSGNAGNTYLDEASAGGSGGNRGQVKVRRWNGAAYVTSSIGGCLHTDTTQTGNVGTGEDTLFTYTMPAATLQRDKDTVRVTFSGTFTASANNKRIRIYLGGTGGSLLFDSGAMAITAAGSWVAEVEIIRTGATTQKTNTRLFATSSTGTALASFGVYATGAETLANALDIVLTGEATDNDDIVAETMKVNFEPAE